MELYDIIEAISSLVKKGTFILHRSMREHPNVKVFKRYIYQIYYLASSGEKKQVNEFIYTEKTESDSILDMWKVCDIRCLQDIIKWITSNTFKDEFGI